MPNVSVPVPKCTALFEAIEYARKDGLPYCTVIVFVIDESPVSMPVLLIVTIVEPVAGGVMVRENVPIGMPS